jgi:two-component system, NarL family, nitrate/nitrite response regulator NarL
VSRTAATVIVASSALLREGMVSLLQDTPYKVMAAVARPAELADHYFAKGRRVLAILGVDWQNGILDQAAESVRLLRSLMPEGKIILVAETNGPVDLQGVLALAPDGYILNLGSRDTLLRSLELMFMDQQIFVLGRSIAAPSNEQAGIQIPERAGLGDSGSRYGFMTNNHPVQLSHREHQVLTCLARGESNKAIARLCHISEATVKVHLKAILRKTNARNRTQAAIWAIEHGLRDSALECNGATADQKDETPQPREEAATDAPPSLSSVESADPRLTQGLLKHSMRS